MLKYIEKKTGFGDNGPAWIARVTTSKSGRSIYFNGKALKRINGGGVAGNHFDLVTGDEYWVSGVKKRGVNRHWAGSGLVQIEAGAVREYLRYTGASELDESQFQIVDDLSPTDPSAFHEHENRVLPS
jgi:hypothetical protein